MRSEVHWPLRGAAPFVTVVQAAEPGQGDDLGVTNGPGLPWAARGRSLGEAEVRAIVLVVRDVLADQAQQMTVVEDDDMVEELATDAADPRSAIPFCHGLLGAVRVGVAPSDLTIETTWSENVASRSNTR